jgi:hypothetical protein
MLAEFFLNKSGRLVNRNNDRPGGRIRFLSNMDSVGGKSHEFLRNKKSGSSLAG